MARWPSDAHKYMGLHVCLNIASVRTIVLD